MFMRREWFYVVSMGRLLNALPDNSRRTDTPSRVRDYVSEMRTEAFRGRWLYFSVIEHLALQSLWILSDIIIYTVKNVMKFNVILSYTILI